MEMYEAKRRGDGRIEIEQVKPGMNLERANTLAQMLRLAIGWAHADDVGQISGEDLPILEDILYYDEDDDDGQREFGLRNFLIHSYDPDEVVFVVKEEDVGNVDIFDLADAIFQDLDDLVEKIFSREGLLKGLSCEDGINIRDSLVAKNARDAARMTAICMKNRFSQVSLPETSNP